MVVYPYLDGVSGHYVQAFVNDAELVGLPALIGWHLIGGDAVGGHGKGVGPSRVGVGDGH